MNWIDKALLAVAPRVALSRMRHQLAAKSVAKQIRKYDAAASGRRTAGWRSSNSSANAETLGASAKVRNLARDLERNNPWAVKALQAIVSNTVGAGILAQPQAANKKRAKQAAALWKQWAESRACDWDGVHDLYGLQALALATAARDGECLVRRRWSTDGGAIPLQLQVLEPDFLDTFRTIGDNGNPIVQGVEVDKDTGKVVAYWLYPYHPGETNLAFMKFGASGLTSSRVPAAEITRVYRQDRAGQMRGVSWFAPVMMTLRDLDDYEDAQLLRQKIAACFTVFVHDATPPEDVTDDTELTIDRVEPGIIETLPPGKEVAFANPPGVEGFGEFERAMLHKVAAGLGITYEALTGDLAQTNYSSGRLGWIEMGRNVDSWRWRMFIPMFCVPVWEWFVEAAAVVGADLTGVTATHTPPRRELINPKEDVAGMVSAIRGGIASWSTTVQELGQDPDELAEQLAADAERFDRLGLTLDIDPRKTTQQGQPFEKAKTTSGAAPQT